MNYFLQIFSAAWEILCLTSPYMLLGFCVAGLLKAFIPDDFIARHLGKNNRSNLFKAALFGVPIPLCSCAVLPAAAGLRQQGASKGATTAFLISTPETGVDSIAVTWSLLDPFMTIVRPVAAFLTALVTGQMVRIWDPDPPQPQTPTTCGCTKTEETQPSCCCSQQLETKPRSGVTPGQRLRKGFSFAFGDLFADIVNWFFVGILIAAIIAVFISPQLVDSWLGNPVIAMLVMLIVSVPLYVCATASTPIAAALLLKGLNPGAALVFLLAGPATNAAAIAVISKILGRKATIIYVAGIIVSSLLLGGIVDLIYGFSSLQPSWQLATAASENQAIGILSALILLALAFRKKIVKKKGCDKGDNAAGCGCQHQ